MGSEEVGVVDLRDRLVTRTLPRLGKSCSILGLTKRKEMIMVYQYISMFVSGFCVGISIMMVLVDTQITRKSSIIPTIIFATGAIVGIATMLTV